MTCYTVTDRVVEDEFISSPVELVVRAHFFWQKPQVSHCLFTFCRQNREHAKEQEGV